MATDRPSPVPAVPPTTPQSEPPRARRPALGYDLVGCALHGHELIGTDAAHVRPEDALFVREGGGFRWYRCVRCDSWLPLTRPAAPAVEYPPDRDQIVLPLRGRSLRDRYVLRLIALERALHVVVLSAVAAAVIFLAGHEASLNADFTRILNGLQGGLGGPVQTGNHGVVHDLQRLFTVRASTLYLAAAGIAAYAGLEAVEAVGLWYGRRWAEYLTFISTAVFVPYEVWELTKSVSALKLVALAVNLAILVYLLLAKRLFGVRGGGPADQARRQADTGWAVLERTAPPTDGPTPPPDQAGRGPTAAPPVRPVRGQSTGDTG